MEDDEEERQFMDAAGKLEKMYKEPALFENTETAIAL